MKEKFHPPHPWNQEYQITVASLLQKHLKKDRSIIGVSGIIQVIEIEKPEILELSSTEQHRLFSHVMNGMGWRVCTRGLGGRPSSWRRP